MIRKVFSFQNENFSIEGQDISLVLSFSEDGFNVIAYSPPTKEIVWVEEYFADTACKTELLKLDVINFLNDYISGLNLLKELKIVFNTESYTPVPVEVFNIESKSKLLFFNEKNIDQSADYIENNTISLGEVKFQLLYSVHSWQRSLSDGLSTSFQQYNDVCLFFQSVLSSQMKSGIFVNNQQHYFDVCILKDGNLVLMNRFSYNNARDFCYFLTGATHTCELIAQDETVHISGLILAESEIVVLLKRYFRDIEYLCPPGIQEYSGLNLHCYYSQLSIL